MFRGIFRMNETCPACGFKFEREPGYFLGSIYINYGLSALISAVTWMTLRYGVGVPALPLAFGLGVFIVIFGSLFFRYARALWLAMDCRFESDRFFEDPPQTKAG
jgi:hypothetical protein